PANQAASHLANADTFTCTGAQNANLPAVASNGMPVVFDTSAPSVTVNGAAVAGVLWGAAYTPTGGSTPVRVAHIKSVNIGANTTVTVQGASGLVLLVDGDVAITGGLNMTTTLNLAAKSFT